MNNRWTLEEESKLLKLIASGKSYKEFSGGFNRSENALELRVKKIIYENISNKKSVSKISELLNMPSEKVMQYYYSYKDHLERESKIKNIEQSGGNNTEKINISKFDNINKFDNNNKQEGGNNMSLNKIEKLELENKKIKLLLENYLLKQKLSKFLKSDNKHLYKDIIKNMINN